MLILNVIKELRMEFFAMLLDDPVVAAGVAVIVSTTFIIGYIAYYFIKNVINSKPR
jgi:hypothetical protein